jgi:hypothetical protein
MDDVVGTYSLHSSINYQVPTAARITWREQTAMAA